MVFDFPDERTRNLAGRAVRAAGYQCFGTGPSTLEGACLLTVRTVFDRYRADVATLIQDAAPAAHRVR